MRIDFPKEEGGHDDTNLAMFFQDKNKAALVRASERFRVAFPVFRLLCEFIFSL